MTGEMLASGGKDLNLRIYDTQTKEVNGPAALNNMLNCLLLPCNL